MSQMKMKNDDAPNKEEQDPSPLWNGGMIYKVLWQLYGTIIRRTKNPSPLWNGGMFQEPHTKSSGNFTER